MVWSPAFTLQAATAAVVLLLAVALYLLRLSHPATRAFALLLFLRGCAGLAYALGTSAADPAVAAYWWRVFPYLEIPLAIVPLYFLTLYPRRLPARRIVGPVVLLAVVALEALYFLDHTLFWDLAARPTGDAASAFGPAVDAPAGPLFALEGLFLVSYAVVAVRFGLEALRESAATRGCTLLVSLGFAVSVLFGGSSLLLNTTGFWSRHPQPLAAVLLASLALSVALVAALGAVLAWRWRTTRDAGLRAVLARYLVVLPLPVVSALVPQDFPADDPMAQAALLVLAAAWRLALPALVAYGLVRHRLFDIDLKVKLAVSRASLAFLFLAVFFIVGEIAQNMLSDTYGVLVGGATAGLLLFAINPLQRMAERVAATALPKVADTPAYHAYRKLQTYRAALEGAMELGGLSPSSRKALDRLRRELGISDGDAAQLEREVAARSSGAGAVAIGEAA